MRVWLVLIVMAASLSGCTSPTSEPDPGTEGVGVITDPKDLSNTTGSHIHDYWQGQSEITVVDGQLSSTWNTVGGSGYWRRTFVPADEVVVPQGTASINVTITWSNGSPVDAYGPVSLWVKPANTVDPRFVQVVADGDTVSVPVLYEEADLPHQLLSAWEFIVQYNVSSMPYTAFFGQTQLKAVAHRGLPLQPFPAHPDLWQDRTEFTLADESRTFQNIGYTGTGNLIQIIRALDGALVPPDAAHVSVAVEVSGAQQAPEAVGAIEVQFHGANTRSWTSLGIVSTQEPAATWMIPVEPGMGDGPYGNASLWQFRIYTPSVSNPTSPAVFVGEFHLTATVHKA